MHGRPTHRRWGHEKAFDDAPHGEADELRGHDEEPLVREAPILAIIFSLRRNNVSLSFPRPPQPNPQFVSSTPPEQPDLRGQGKKTYRVSA
jgi:hypothetical protein